MDDTVCARSSDCVHLPALMRANMRADRRVTVEVVTLNSRGSDAYYMRRVFKDNARNAPCIVNK